MNNEIETVDLKKFKRQQKINEIKQKIINGTKSTIEWLTDNKEGIAAAIVIGSGVGKVTRTCIRHHDLKKEQHYKDTMKYDHSTGHRVELKRKLRGRDVERIRKYREQTGCNYTDALYDLNLMKR